MSHPILYSFRRCPYAMRARLAISSARRTVVLREVVLRDKPEAMIEVSPKGTVPVLILADGQVIDESYDVMNWALGEGGASADERALVMQCDEEFKPYLDQYKYPNKQENYDRDQTLLNAGMYLSLLDEHLEKNEFLFGDERGFADIGIAPFVRQFAHVDREWFMQSKWKNVIRWYSEFIEWDGFKTIMIKHPKWVDGDAVTLFP